MAGVPSKGSASIISGAIIFTAPENFEGYSEIGYRITDTIWNIDVLGTVKIYAESLARMPTPLGGNVKTPGSIIKELPIFKKLIYVILASVLSIGVIIYFSIKKRNGYYR